MIHTFEYFPTKPPMNDVVQVMKCLTMGDSAQDKELLQELLGESYLEDHFEEEETDAEQLGHAHLEKEKGNMVYIVDDEEVENLDVEHT